MGQVGVATPPVGGNFDATYSSQLSLETNNSGVEHFSRDALGRRSISEKHHAALDARETGTYQRNKKLREERERERRIQLTKSAVYGGSIESLTARIASANAQMAAAAAGYKHAKTSSHIEQREREQQQQLIAAEAEARDQLGDLGPSLGMKKSSSLESLQTMVQELQMSDEPRAHHALRAPRGRGREDSLRAAVVSEPDANSKSRLAVVFKELQLISPSLSSFCRTAQDLAAGGGRPRGRLCLAAQWTLPELAEWWQTWQQVTCQEAKHIARHWTHVSLWQESQGWRSACR